MLFCYANHPAREAGEGDEGDEESLFLRRFYTGRRFFGKRFGEHSVL